jgi:hypothetical protein
LVAADSSGFGNDGQLMDGPSWWELNRYPPQGALFFDGVHNHVNVGNSPSLNPSDEITLAARIAPYDLSVSGEIIAKNNGTDPQYYLRVQAGGRIRFGIGATVLNGNTTLSPSRNFQLVAGTYDGSTMKIYVDGVLDAVMNKNGPMHDNDIDVWIGSRHFQNPLAFNGLIDDVRIFSRALSANEIQSLAIPPGQVVITSPASGQEFVIEWWDHCYLCPPPGVYVGLTADVFNFSTPVTKVDFYEFDYLIGTATQAPYSVVYQYPAVGRHDQIVAVATDNLGNRVSSDPNAFSFYVCGEYEAPYLTIISPARGEVFAYGDPIYISLDTRGCGARFAGGIDLYDAGTFPPILLGHLDNWNDFVWQNAPVGFHTIHAVSTSTDWLEDSLGITVAASHPPTVAITSPTSVFNAPADVPVHVTAQDADGSVVQIDLSLIRSSDGTTTTFTSTATDFDYTFLSLAAGYYTLTATATDNTGTTASSSIDIAVVTRPVNDNFANSFDLAQITSGNNVNATREPGEPPSHNPDGASAGYSVWWHWTAPSDGPVVISTGGSFVDTVVAVYTGNAVDNLHLITWNNDRISGSRAAIALFSAVAGTTYQIAVDAEPGVLWGDIQLNVYYGPPVPPTVAITTPAEGAVFTAPAYVPVHVTAQDSDGSVLLVQLTDGTTTFRTAATDFDYTFLSLAAGNYTLTATATDNVGAVGTSSVHITVRTATPPANDDFANSFDLAQITTGNNVDATRETGEPPNYGFGHSVWWHYTAPADGLAVFSTVGSSFPTGMAIYSGNALDNLSLVTWYYDFNNYRPAILWFNLVAGTTYQIVVDGLTGASGDIQLNVNYDAPPTFTITSPTGGEVFTAPADMPVHVTAQDPDGSVAQIELSLVALTNGTTTIFTSNTADLDYTFPALAAGNYQLIVRVTDNLGIMVPNSVVFTVGN